MARSLSRSNQSFLGAFEKPLLAWLAEKLPRTITPDLLTTIGISGAGLAAFSYALTNYSKHFIWLAGLGIVLNWFGDSLDGTVARLRMAERPRYGLFVDHTADLISQVVIGIGFGMMPFIQLSSALLLLTSYLVFVAHTFIRALVFQQITITYFSVGPTEVRLMLIVCGLSLVYIPFFSQPLIGSLAFSDLFAIGLAIISFAGFLVQAYDDLRTLSKES